MALFNSRSSVVLILCASVAPSLCAMDIQEQKNSRALKLKNDKLLKQQADARDAIMYDAFTQLRDKSTTLSKKDIARMPVDCQRTIAKMFLDMKKQKAKEIISKKREIARRKREEDLEMIRQKKVTDYFEARSFIPFIDECI
jgi:hypothetical protein